MNIPFEWKEKRNDNLSSFYKLVIAKLLFSLLSEKQNRLLKAKGSHLVGKKGAIFLWFKRFFLFFFFLFSLSFDF